jgi:hypothetical protein
MRRLLASVLAFTLVLLLAPAFAQDGKFKTSKAALQALQDYIGNWNGSGSPGKAGSKEIWKESIEWGWKFKGSDAWLVMTFKGDKKFKSGEIRYLMDKKVYQLTVLDKEDKELVFLGKLEGEYFTLERVDPTTKETQQLKMNTAAEGARLVIDYSVKPANRTVFSKEMRVAATKEGLSLGVKEKKNECVVSGGLGTSTVTYKGQTYYVCCSGCREAFNEDPEKYIKEFEAKKKKGGN